MSMCQKLRDIHVTSNALTKKFQSKPYRISKYNRYCEIQEAIQASTLKVKLSYIVYNST